MDRQEIKSIDDNPLCPPLAPSAISARVWFSCFIALAETAKIAK